MKVLKSLITLFVVIAMGVLVYFYVLSEAELKTLIIDRKYVKLTKS